MTFSAPDRDIAGEDYLELLSVGIDIGSATTHLIFSRLTLVRRNARYELVNREVVTDSRIMLTPYSAVADDIIDVARLRAFIDEEYARAGLDPAAVDTGALILTGLASERRNARAIGEMFAADSGRFVTFTAGDALEATLAAHGSGAVRRSRHGAACVSVDIGGGTAKIARCERGEVVAATALDVGARLLLFDGDGVVTRVEAPCRALADRLGLRFEVGAKADEADLRALAAALAEAVRDAVRGGTAGGLLRLPPIDRGDPVDVVLLSGGVAELIRTDNPTAFGDLGHLLAEAVVVALATEPYRLDYPAAPIRATSVGLSQYTVQLSGTTIFVSDPGSLPLRNIAVVRPVLPLGAATVSEAAVAARVTEAIERRLGPDRPDLVAIAVRWQGSATYSRLQALGAGLLAALRPWLARGAPLILVNDSDIGGLLGMNLREQAGPDQPIVSIDSIELQPFDLIDIGAFVPASGAVPVVIKSLLLGAQPTNIRHQPEGTP